MSMGKKSTQKSKETGTGITLSAVSIIVLLVMFVGMAVGSLILFQESISIGASEMFDSYNASFAEERENAYLKLYQSAYDRAMDKYHVSNTVVITIGNLEETQKLEVLKANDVEFVAEDRDSNSGNVTAWLEVEGEGTFVVDLKAAEYIIDNEHQYVLVRIPGPELTDVAITQVTRRLFADDFLNGSYREGVDLALKQRNQASLQIQKALLSNQFIYDSAKKAAVSMISNLVRQFNQDVPDLRVDVEFLG